MHLPLAITSVLFFGSYVTAIPVEPQNREESPGLHFPWEQIGGGASGSGLGNNFGAPAPHDAIHYPAPNHPPPNHSSLGHHNVDNLPGPPEGPPPLGKVLGDSRGGLFGLPYRCTGCGRQSPGPELRPGPSVNHPVPSTPVNHDNPNPSTRTGQGGADRRTRTRHRNAGPYARPGRSDPGGSGAGGSNGDEPGPGVGHAVPNTPVNHDNPNPSTRTGQGGADRRTRAARNRNPKPYARPGRSDPGGSGASDSNGGAVGIPHATGGGTDGSDIGPPDADGRYRCLEPHCPYSTRRKGDFRRHGQVLHSTEKNHACPDCDAAFNARTKLTRHHRGAHPESVLPPIQRVRTSRVAKVPYTRTGPGGSNAGPPPHIQCPKLGCSSSLYNDRSTVLRHFREIHDINKKSFPCTTPGCGSTFTRKYRLKNHREATGHS